MADISLKFKAEELGKSIEGISTEIENELNMAVKNLAEAAYSSMIAEVQGMSMDPKNRQDYLRALKFQDLGGDAYLIYLDSEWANKLEEGFSGYSIKDKLLQSQKTVKVGSRAGEKWVRQDKHGQRYAAVPFEHKPFSKDVGGSGDLAKEIRKLMGQDVRGHRQKITKIFKNPEGKPLSGKVATAYKPENPMLKGLTKYQHVHDSGKVSSVYLTYRIVHENSSGWQHPGWKGYSIFKRAEEYVEKELENIINTLL